MKYVSVSLPDSISKDQLVELLKVGYEEIYEEKFEKSEIKVYG